MLWNVILQVQAKDNKSFWRIVASYSKLFEARTIKSLIWRGLSHKKAASAKFFRKYLKIIFGYKGDLIIAFSIKKE